MKLKRKKKAPTRKKATKKKVIKRRVTKKKVTKKPRPKVAAAAKENVIGVVTHYFPKVRAGVIKLKAPLSIGDTIKFKGHTTDFIQTVTSLQIDHVPINSAKKGQEIGLLVNSRVRGNDIVYKV